MILNVGFFYQCEALIFLIFFFNFYILFSGKHKSGLINQRSSGSILDVLVKQIFPLTSHQKHIKFVRLVHSVETEEAQEEETIKAFALKMHAGSKL